MTSKEVWFQSLFPWFWGHWHSLRQNRNFPAFSLPHHERVHTTNIAANCTTAVYRLNLINDILLPPCPLSLSPPLALDSNQLLQQLLKWVRARWDCLSITDSSAKSIVSVGYSTEVTALRLYLVSRYSYALVGCSVVFKACWTESVVCLGCGTESWCLPSLDAAYSWELRHFRQTVTGCRR